MGLSATVLFAGDDPAVRQSLAQLLSMSGYRVLTAEDGFEALRLLTQQEIDVLLTDIVMPGLDGVEVARRALQQVPGLKVLYASGYTAGFGPVSPLLKKPYRAHQLAGEIAAVLSQ